MLDSSFVVTGRSLGHGIVLTGVSLLTGWFYLGTGDYVWVQEDFSVGPPRSRQFHPGLEGGSRLGPVNM